MSKLLIQPLPIPKGVEVISLDPFTVQGPCGKYTQQTIAAVSIIERDRGLYFQSAKQSPIVGLQRALVRNLMAAASSPHSKVLKLVGVGFRAAVVKGVLELQVGKSHPSVVAIPQGIEIKIDKETTITISGSDKQRVGQYASTVRSFSPPEPYKGKGIRYLGENIRRKGGKTAKGK